MTVKGFKKCRISSAVDGTDDDMLWIGSEEGGNVGSKCEEDVGTDCEDKVTLIGKGGQNLTSFLYLVYAVNRHIFFLSRHFIFGKSSYIWLNTFSLRRHVLSVGGVILDYSHPAFG